jgi:hypothetical protein
MSRSTKDYEIGHGRPPKATQWKKGQSPNRGGLSSRRSIGVAETLWNKTIAGDRRARAVFFRWLELAPQVADGAVEITFANSDYTRAFTSQSFPGESRR